MIGGGENHRLGLFDMVLVKDNHIAVAGGVANALDAVAQYLRDNNLDVGVEVCNKSRVVFERVSVFLYYFLENSQLWNLLQIETRTLDEVKEVLAHRGKGIGHVTRIMLDNMVVPLPDGDVDISMLKQAVKLIDGQVETEVLGSLHICALHLM